MLPTSNNLELLAVKATDCGEQNMINFAPDVYILKYLDSIGKLDIEGTDKDKKQLLVEGIGPNATCN